MPLSQPKSQPLNVPQALAQALKLHEQGRLTEAERLYAAILAVRPDHFDALQMMGLVKLAAGQPAEALRLVSGAMASRKPSPQILLNHGLILDALQRHEEAVASFDQALKLKSKYAEAHNNRGATLVTLGRGDEGLGSCRKAIALKPDYVEAHYNAGTALRALGRYEEALKSFDRTLALRPNYFKAHNNRGAVLEGLKRYDEALVCYDRALALAPYFTEARNNRGRILVGLDRADEAIENFSIALSINPNDAEAWYQRGRHLLDIGRTSEAAADFARVLALRPNHAEARFAACFAELPVVYRKTSEIARQRVAYEQKLRALSKDIDSGLLQDDLIKAIGARHPFLLAYQGGNDRELQQVYGEMVSRIVAGRYPPAPLPPPPAPGEPIRVGIVSAFFYSHSNWKIPIKGWVSQLDRSRFRVTGYHLGVLHDAQTDVAAGLCDRFVHRTIDTDGWRREILADAPHVLIYPGLLMDASSLQLAAQRLAPVQCNSWGHPETSGLPTLDYFLSSDLMEAPGAEAYYTEKLVRLPNLSIYYEPVEREPVVVTREELGLRPGATVFWSAQSLFKYLPQHDDVFPRIALAAGDCQFVFLRHFGGADITRVVGARLDIAFAKYGLRAVDYCVFLDRLSQSKFVAVAGLSDVFLDSIGWSGCNSVLESLPQNLPIVTMAGQLMRGRHSSAILRMMGVTETLAETVDDYVSIAARLAKDPAERQALRERMKAGEQKVYRDRACISALEDFLDRAVRSPGGPIEAPPAR
ncbi:MAG TPA: tetratricopeptide repeat protein [Pseudolabrys sp.]|jgi:predicted O-linked N-acetylglucosamine transferase (SPINDLY family)